eukprot:3414289-Rhodomonas_salina.1
MLPKRKFYMAKVQEKLGKAPNFDSEHCDTLTVPGLLLLAPSLRPSVRHVPYPVPQARNNESTAIQSLEQFKTIIGIRFILKN